MSKVIITIALNGSVPTKEMNPHTPITHSFARATECRPEVDRVEGDQG